jgi:hypothetical protein
MFKKDLILCIQARLGSTRLPAKIFFSFFGELIINRIIRISKKIIIKKKIYILSGSKKLNKELSIIAKKNKIKIFFGSETNVHLRFKNFLSNLKKKPKYIIRITSDNYLAHPMVIKKMIKFCETKKFDYCYIDPLSHYSGEIIKSSLFFKKKPSLKAKEHVTWDFRHAKDIKIISYPEGFLGIDHKRSITLDSLDDFKTLIKLEHKYPNLKKINCIEEIKKIKF